MKSNSSHHLDGFPGAQFADVPDGGEVQQERLVLGAERNRGPAIEEDVKRSGFATDCHATYTYNNSFLPTNY